MGGGGSTPTTPPPRDVAQEGEQTLQSQIKLAPDQYAAYAKYAPQYAQTDVQSLGQSLFGQGYTGNLTDINSRLGQYTNQQNAQSNTFLRQANQNDVTALAPGMMETLRQFNPEFYSQLGRQGQMANAGVGANPYQQQMQGLAGSNLFNPVSLGNVNGGNVSAQGGNAALDQLQQQYLNNPGGLSANQTMADQTASNLLAQGGNLSPSEMRSVEQASRGAFAARGLGGSNSSIVNEAMNTDAAKRARLVQNVGIAQGIEGQSQAERQNAQNLGMGISGQNLNYGQMGLQAGLANQQMNYQSQLANNQNILAQQSGNLGALQQQYGLYGQMSQDDLLRQQQNFAMGQQGLSNYAGAQFDPYAALLGQQSLNQNTNAGLFGQASGTNTGSNAYTQQMFNPYNSYAQDIYNTNYNAQASSNISQANNAAANKAGQKQMIGTGVAAAGTIALAIF